MCDATKCDVCGKHSGVLSPIAPKWYACNDCYKKHEEKKQFTRMVVKDNGRND